MCVREVKLARKYAEGASWSRYLDVPLVIPRGIRWGYKLIGNIRKTAAGQYVVRPIVGRPWDWKPGWVESGVALSAPYDPRDPGGFHLWLWAGGNWMEQRFRTDLIYTSIPIVVGFLPEERKAVGWGSRRWWIRFSPEGGRGPDPVQTVVHRIWIPPSEYSRALRRAGYDS